jgi:hypothetical protein
MVSPLICWKQGDDVVAYRCFCSRLRRGLRAFADVIGMGGGAIIIDKPVGRLLLTLLYLSTLPSRNICRCGGLYWHLVQNCTPSGCRGLGDDSIAALANVMFLSGCASCTAFHNGRMGHGLVVGVSLHRMPDGRLNTEMGGKDMT